MTKQKEFHRNSCLQRIEDIKILLSEPGENFDVFTARLELQDLYKKVMLMDLNKALDNKLEQELWSHAFKNHINDFQSKIKNKNTPKRFEMQATFNLFLEAASGFYTQFLLSLSHTFNVKLSFMTSTVLDIYVQNHRQIKVKSVNKSSVMTMCQYCLVHLGDIARYRHQAAQAETYYRLAISLVPSSGQPFNQLAILASQSGNKLLTVFYHIRSLALKYPFRVAMNNLEKVYHKYSDELKNKTQTTKDFTDLYVQLHGIIHLDKDINIARHLTEKLILNISQHISSGAFRIFEMIQFISINIFSIAFIQHQLDDDVYKYSEVKHETSERNNNKCDLIFCLTIFILESLLSHTPKQEAKAKDFYTLPAIKITLQWLLLSSDRLSHRILKESPLWTNFSKLLNCIQFCFKNSNTDLLTEYEKYPLNEDFELQCFTPIAESQSSLDFTKKFNNVENAAEIQTQLRCLRLIDIGKSVCEKYPSLTLLSYTRLNTGKYQFQAPSTMHIKVIDGSTSNEQLKQTVAVQAEPTDSKNIISGSLSNISITDKTEDNTIPLPPFRRHSSSENQICENRSLAFAIGHSRKSQSPKRESDKKLMKETDNDQSSQSYSLFGMNESNWFDSIKTPITTSLLSEEPMSSNIGMDIWNLPTVTRSSNGSPVINWSKLQENDKGEDDATENSKSSLEELLREQQQRYNLLPSSEPKKN